MSNPENNNTERIIDLRSDTVTYPTDEMREAMKNAPVGDDVYQDDPTVLALEEKAANLLQKEAALFVPSGTFGNQLAILTHCKAGNEVILDDECHIVQHEAGAAALISRVQLRTIECKNRTIPLDEIERKIRKGDDIHFPDTGLICLENAHGSGHVIPLSEMEGVYNLAKKYNIPVHLDGARLFNAAAALNVDAKEIAKYTDSLTFCLSKGLCAPIGSIVVGTRDFIERARKNRKIMGGALRQAGVLAAPGIIALDKMTKRLHEDHENAKILREELSKIDGITVIDNGIQINMVFFDMTKTGYDSEKLVSELLKRGVKVNGEEAGLMRFVTHYWVSADDVRYVADLVKQIIS